MKLGIESTDHSRLYSGEEQCSLVPPSVISHPTSLGFIPFQALTRIFNTRHMSLIAMV